MRSQIENRLKQLKAPDAPKDLKARCMATIPASVRDAPRFTNASPTHRTFAFPKIAAMVALMLSTAVVAAFWNTRPVGDKTIEPSGSVAFAQTVQAMERVTVFHLRISRHTRIRSSDGRVSKRSTYSENWMDIERGALLVSSHEPLFNAPGVESRLADGNTAFDRVLQLPNGKIYTRNSKSRVLVVETDPNQWKVRRKEIVILATGDFKSLLGTGRENQLVSSTLGNWKGQPARIFVFREKVEIPKTKKPAPDTTKTKLYVDPATKRLVGIESFTTSVTPGNDTAWVNAEIQIDYQKPAPEVFDPAPLKKGAIRWQKRTETKRKIS